MPLVFCNLIGGQDELVFDGNSFVMDAKGTVTQRAPAFTEGMYVVDLGWMQPARSSPIPATSCRCRARRRACTARWCRARATMSTSTAFPAW